MKNASATLIALVIFILTACQSAPDYRANSSQGDKIRSVTRAYFDVYKQRENLDALMQFYAEEAVLEDMVYGERKEGKQAIAQFFDWANPQFEKLSPDVLVVEHLLVESKTAVASGHFTPFRYHGQALGPWRFVIVLKFDTQGKIIKQTDWINYTPKEQFTGGKNLN